MLLSSHAAMLAAMLKVLLLKVLAACGHETQPADERGAGTEDTGGLTSGGGSQPS